jgi:hypothetical protein
MLGTYLFDIVLLNALKKDDVRCISAMKMATKRPYNFQHFNGYTQNLLEISIEESASNSSFLNGRREHRRIEYRARSSALVVAMLLPANACSYIALS